MGLASGLKVASLVADIVERRFLHDRVQEGAYALIQVRDPMKLPGRVKVGQP